MARCGCGGGTCNCLVVAGSGIAVDGSGTVANPFVVSTGATDCEAVRPCISAGNGLAYNPASGVMTARPSGDAGNIMDFGGDGGLYAHVDCSAVRPCISAGEGMAYSPVTGVMSVHRSADAGNNLILGTDSGLFVPAGASTVTVGCGLTGNGSAGAPVTAATATSASWDYACDLDDAAGRIFCDGDGVLRGEPPGRMAYFTANQSQTFPSPAVPAGTDVSVLTPTLMLTNPDPCRDALVLSNADLDVDWTLPVGAGAEVGIGPDDMQYVVNRGTATVVSIHTQMTKTLRRIIPAGGTLLETLPITMGNGTGGAVYTRIQWGLNCYMWAL